MLDLTGVSHMHPLDIVYYVCSVCAEKPGRNRLQMKKTEPKHLYAEKKIREAIARLDVDDRLPGERTFAKELGIAYMTARKAVENLVAEGLLYKIPKKGTFVADPRKRATATRNIGYFLDSSIKDGVSSPYYSLIFDALEKEATRNSYALIYFSNDGTRESMSILSKMDGAIVSCFPRIESVIQEMKKQLPVVCIDNRSSDRTIPSVTIDNFNSVIDSIDCLLSMGHERIGFITGLDDSDVGRNRLAGYMSAMEKHGIRKDMELVFRGDYSFETGKKGADYFLSLDKPPTAIMCANDTMAISAIKEIFRRGFRVPEDISIIGFDDITIASQITPALSTISVPVEDIARYAMKLLEAAIAGDSGSNPHITLPCRLVERETCADLSSKKVAAS
jgi:LacI family repressor for deo operon, udp, cdd, tsx, nupC, and nupG